MFWDNLKTPLLQDIVFHYINHIDDYIKIAKELLKQRSNLTNSNPKNLAFIILKNLHENSLKINERLSFYQNDVRINNLSEYERNNSIIKKGKITYDNWQVRRTGIYVEIIDILKGILSVKDIEDWTFSYKPKSTPKNEYTDRYNSEIKNVLLAYKTVSKSQTLNTKLNGLGRKFSLQKFNFILSEVDDLTKKQSEIFLSELFNFVETEDFYWDKTYSPPYWESLKNIGYLLSLVNNPITKAYEIIDRVRINYEGWNISSNDYKLINKEVFFLCGVTLLIEHESAFSNKDERTLFFKNVLNFVINQTRFISLNSIDNYILPLHLLYLTINQIYLDLKYCFEKELIQNIDDLGCVLKILSSENYKLKPNSLRLLKKRVDNEILFEKRKFMRNKNKKDIEVLDNMIKKLDLV